MSQIIYDMRKTCKIHKIVKSINIFKVRISTNECLIFKISLIYVKTKLQIYDPLFMFVSMAKIVKHITTHKYKLILKIHDSHYILVAYYKHTIFCNK